MNTFARSGILLSALAVFSLSAQAQEPSHSGPGGTGAHAARSAPAARPAPGRGPHDVRFAHGGLPARNFGGHAYHGRVAWEGGRWRHEMHNGRMGWWWDVGGVWYFYPQAMEGPPAYVSDVEVYDDAGGPDGPPVADGYPPPPGAYAPPPPPPAPDPAASVVGGAVVGGLLGGLISGRPVGAAVGAVTGATVGAIAGAQAARRPGYYWSQGAGYFRYPSGQYAPVDPGYCG